MSKSIKTTAQKGLKPNFIPENEGDICICFWEGQEIKYEAKGNTSLDDWENVNHGTLKKVEEEELGAGTLITITFKLESRADVNIQIKHE